MRWCVILEPGQRGDPRHWARAGASARAPATSTMRPHSEHVKWWCGAHVAVEAQRVGPGSSVSEAVPRRGAAGSGRRCRGSPAEAAAAPCRCTRSAVGWESVARTTSRMTRRGRVSRSPRRAGPAAVPPRRRPSGRPGAPVPGPFLGMILITEFAGLLVAAGRAVKRCAARSARRRGWRSPGVAVHSPPQEDRDRMAQPSWLRIEGARQNNLKNVSLAIPHDRRHRGHRRLGVGQVLARLRHPLRRGAVAVHRVAVHLRPDVPRARRPARRGPHRAHPARHRPRAEEPGADGPLHGGDGHRAATTTCASSSRKIGRVHCPRVRRARRGATPRSSVADALVARAPRGAGPRHASPCPRRRARPAPTCGPPSPGAASRGSRSATSVLDLRRRRPPGGRPRDAPAPRSRSCSTASCSTRRAARPPRRVARGGLRRGRAAGPRCRSSTGRGDRREPRVPLPGLRDARSSGRSRCSSRSTTRSAPAPSAAASATSSATTRTSWCPTRRRSLADGAVEPWSHPSGRWYQKQLAEGGPTRGVDVEPAVRRAARRRTARWVYAGRRRASPASRASSRRWSPTATSSTCGSSSRATGASRRARAAGARGSSRRRSACSVGGRTIAELAALTVESLDAFLDGLAAVRVGGRGGPRRAAPAPRPSSRSCSASGSAT